MLVLQRKVGESFLIGEDITVSIIGIEGNRARIAISAPNEVPILRSELVQTARTNPESAVEESAPEQLLSLLGSVLERPAAPQPVVVKAARQQSAATPKPEE